MSGLVVYPGDTLFLAVTDAWPGSVTEIEADFEARMPGVTVKLTGHMGGPFVYRPDPPDVMAEERKLDVPDCPCGTVDLAACPSTRFVGQLGWDITCAGCGNDLMYVADFNTLPKERNITVMRRDW